MSMVSQLEIAQADPKNWAVNELKLRLAECQHHELQNYIFRCAQSSWFVNVTIRAEYDSELPTYLRETCQVPIEPESITSLYDDDLLLLTWIINPSHSLELIQHPGAPCLIAQAREAGLKLDMLLAFELSGVPAPRVYDNWREPDGVDIPLKADVKGMPHYGAVTTLYTNGELALVLLGDRSKCEQVHVKSLISAVPAAIAGFTATNTKRAVPADLGHGKELSDEEVKVVAAKFIMPNFKKNQDVTV